MRVTTEPTSARQRAAYEAMLARPPAADNGTVSAALAAWARRAGRKLYDDPAWPAGWDVITLAIGADRLAALSTGGRWEVGFAGQLETTTLDALEAEPEGPPRLVFAPPDSPLVAVLRVWQAHVRCVTPAGLGRGLAAELTWRPPMPRKTVAFTGVDESGPKRERAAKRALLEREALGLLAWVERGGRPRGTTKVPAELFREQVPILWREFVAKWGHPPSQLEFAETVLGMKPATFSRRLAEARAAGMPWPPI